MTTCSIEIYIFRLLEADMVEIFSEYLAAEKPDVWGKLKNAKWFPNTDWKHWERGVAKEISQHPLWETYPGASDQSTVRYTGIINPTLFRVKTGYLDSSKLSSSKFVI